MLGLSNFQFTHLTDNLNLAGFDCGDSEINEFLHHISIAYNSDMIANTYLFLDENEIVAYFSISNNCLKDMGENRGYNRKIWKKLHKQNKIPYQKQIKQYPAILIGRLGVNSKHQGSGLAYELMDFIKGWVLVDHKPACRFLILDAYNKPKQIKYYERNDFSFLLEEDHYRETRTMYYDMKSLQ